MTVINDQFREEFEALSEMAGTRGWDILVRDTKARMDAFREGVPFNIPNNESLWLAKGLFVALNEIVSLRDSLEKRQELALQEPPEEEDQ